jgi:hypothetical protein
MLMLLLHSKTAWNDYFPGSSTNFNSQTYNSRQTPSYTGVYVSNCLYGPITLSSAGGALSCSSVQYLLVEFSSFFSCITSNYGGAIRFENTSNGQCVLYGLCGYDCYTTSNYNVLFGYVYVNNGISSKNYFNYSSISRCISDNSYSNHILIFGNGKICCPSVNISMNKCYSYSIYCYSVSDSSFTCSFTCSSFIDNTATGSVCFYLWRTGVNFEINSCNIIRNSQVSLNSEGTICTNGNLMIKDSCILENTANRIFYQGSSYTITLSNCIVDSTSSNGYLTTRNTVTKSFILALNHMSTQNCHSEYDSAGTLTPIIQTPSSSKKQRLCYTGHQFFLHLQPRDIFSLIGILIFNFIHPYAFDDSFY